MCIEVVSGFANVKPFAVKISNHEREGKSRGDGYRREECKHVRWLRGRLHARIASRRYRLSLRAGDTVMEIAAICAITRIDE